MGNKIDGAPARLYIREETMYVRPDGTKPCIGGQKGIPYEVGVSILNA
jgi:hypothetical protein